MIINKSQVFLLSQYTKDFAFSDLHLNKFDELKVDDKEDDYTYNDWVRSSHCL